MARKENFSNLELICGLIGFSPIPIAGEICSAIFLGKLVKETEIFDKEKHTPYIIGAAAGLLARFGMYETIYSPIIKYILNNH